MTEHDLSMLHDWLNRPHIDEWWGADDARPTFEQVCEKYMPRIMESEAVTPYIVELDGEPIGYAQSYVAMGRDDGWWENETDPGVRGIDQFLANAEQLGRGLGTQLVRALVTLLFSDPTVTKIQTDPSPKNLRAIRCYEKAGFVKQRVIETPYGPAMFMTQTRAEFGHANSLAVARPSILS